MTTLIESVRVPIQPKGLLPVMLYTVVTVGLKVNDDAVILPGLVVKLSAPDKFTVVVFPAQIVGLFGVTVIEGMGFTLIVIAEVFTHPFKS